MRETVQEEAESELRRAIEQLYQVFSSYEPAPDHFIGCGCGTCVTEEQQESLHTTPLRELGFRDLDAISSSAINEPSDLKYFLPRVAELLSDDSVASYDYPQAYFAQLATDWGWGTWRDWPEDERQAIEHYFRRLWQREVTKARPDSETVDSLEATDALEERLWSYGRLFEPSPHHAQSWRRAIAAAPPSLREDVYLQGAMALAQGACSDSPPPWNTLDTQADD